MDFGVLQGAVSRWQVLRAVSLCPAAVSLEGSLLLSLSLSLAAVGFEGVQLQSVVLQCSEHCEPVAGLESGRKCI